MVVAVVTILAQAGVAASPDPVRVAQSDAARTVAFHIASSPMSEALTALGAQSGLTIIVESRISKGIKAAALSGQYTPDEALRKLLEPAGLKAEYLDSKTVAVRLASESDSNGFETSQTGYEGSLSLVARSDQAGSKTIVDDQPASAGRPLRIAQADKESPSAQQEGPTDGALEEVIVTGSTLKTATVGEIERGAMPIDVVTRAELERNPGESLARILKKQPYFSGANENPANIWSSEGDLARSTVNLRGMGSKYTQVVMDGRRFSSDTRPADLGALPTEAIDSTLILTGGASSIYGPNAVAGVVDIRLRKDFEGFQLSTEYGQSSRSDAANARYSALFGTNTERFRLVASAQYLDGDGLRRQDRALTATEDLRRWGGRDWRTESSSLPALYARSSNPDELLVLDTDRVGLGQAAVSAADFRAFDQESASSDIYGWIEEPTNRSSAHFVTEYDLAGERLQLYAIGFYDRMKIGPVPKFYEWMFPEEDILVSADNPYNPLGEDVLVKYYRFSAGEHGGYYSKGVNETTHGTGGLRGRFGRFRYDLGINYHKSESVIDNPHFFWAANPLEESLALADGSGVNLFGNHANTPAQVASLAARERVQSREQMESVDAKVSGPLLQLPGGDLQGSVVVERRDGRSWWQNDGGDYGWFHAPGFNGASVERKVDAYAGELLAPLYRAKEGALLTLIEVGAGTRYEDFVDSGTQYEWQTCESLPCESSLIGGGRSRMNTQISQFTLLLGLLDDSLRLRAAYGGGFVSPTPLDLMSPVVTEAVVEFDPVTGEEGLMNLTSGGDLGLLPEKAGNITYGFTWSPRSLPGLELNVDLWDVEIKNRVTYPDLAQVLLGISDAGSVQRDPDTNFPTEVDLRVANGDTHRLSGVDVGTHYSWETEGGHRFGTNLGLTYTSRGSIGSRRIIGRYNWGETLPRLVGTAGLEWRRQKWSVSFDVQYRGGVSIPAYDPDIEDYTDAFGSKTKEYVVGNVYAGYDFGDDPFFSRGVLSKASVWLGIEDLWDEDVPFIDLWGQGYDSNSSNIRGRYLYCGVRVGF